MYTWVFAIGRPMGTLAPSNGLFTKQVASAATSDEPYKFIKVQSGSSLCRFPSKSSSSCAPLSVQTRRVRKHLLAVALSRSTFAKLGTVTKQVTCSLAIKAANSDASLATAVGATTSGRPYDNGPSV